MPKAAASKSFKPTARKILISEEEAEPEAADATEKPLAATTNKTSKAADVAAPTTRAAAPKLAEVPAPAAKGSELPEMPLGEPPAPSPTTLAPEDILSLRKKYRIPMQKVASGNRPIYWIIVAIVLVVIGGLAGLLLTGQL